MKEKYYADAQAFLGFPGQPPKIEKDLQLDLALVTCAPPAGPHAESFAMTLAACSTFKAQLEETGAVNIITRASELNMDDEKLEVVLGLQNLPRDINFKAAYKAGIRVVALAYDGANRFGSGCLNLDMGLTLEGRSVIELMADHGLILDLSHAGHRMAREVLEYVDKENLNIPIMASHGGCYALYPHFRNLPDDVLVAIAERGGVVGIANLTFILASKGNDGMDAFYAHLNHAVKICGPRAVVVGSDAPYITYTEQEERGVFEKMKDLIDPDGTWAARCPMYTSEFAGPQKLEKMAMPPVPGVLQLGLNLKNFFKRSLPK